LEFYYFKINLRSWKNFVYLLIEQFGNNVGYCEKKQGLDNMFDKDKIEFIFMDIYYFENVTKWKMIEYEDIIAFTRFNFKIIINDNISNIHITY
jgi:hypothetical protein